MDCRTSPPLDTHINALAGSSILRPNNPCNSVRVVLKLAYERGIRTLQKRNRIMSHMGIRDLVGTVMCLWLASIVACAISFRWALFSFPRRFWPAVAFSALALIGGFVGIYYRVIASTMSNGRVRWKFDSRPFFIVTVILAAFTLTFTIWRKKKLRLPAAGT